MQEIFTGADPLPLLAALVRCPSITPDSAGVFDVVQKALAPLGFTINRLRFTGGGSYPVDNLFATRGDSGPHLAFAGHTDVVPPGDARDWRHPPFAAEIADGKLYGRGAADMKSGVAAFITAAMRAVADGSADRGRLSLLITNDEEADAINGTERLMHWAADSGHRFDFVLVGEPSATARVGDSIKIGRRGSLNAEITVTGAQGHVAYPDQADNPLPLMARIIGELTGKLDAGNAHFPPTNLEFTSIDVGNTASNVIPGRAVARFNVRYNDGWTPDTLVAQLEGQLSRIAGTAARLKVLGRPSRSFLSPTGGPVDLLCAVIQSETGTAPELSTGGGTSDARFIAPFCPVAEFGLPGPSMHKTDENVAIADVEALARLYHRFIGRFLAGTGTAA